MNNAVLKTVSSAAFQRGVWATVARQGPSAAMAAPQNLGATRRYHLSPPLSQQHDIPVHEQQVLIAHHLHNNNPHLLGSLSVRHPATPFVLGWGEVECEMRDSVMEDPLAESSIVDPPTDSEVIADPMLEDDEGLSLMNRNARKPKKANHGSRPNSRVARRARRRQYGNWKRRLR
eukprot:CAMPEP_0172439384 /NCGR_PEP_ID=MMETSP1065-20121228/388_1 /TAXON_ID=265537 /ORGANISM="Amphiprora paludosa, Strain CCMP125" /LENGTH=174 /DNA_ID=CAMNT_0013188063 /DNA_START=77 /DNA_END=601 /DNA_ORIENTATION=+